MKMLPSSAYSVLSLMRQATVESSFLRDVIAFVPVCMSIKQPVP
jgi:hypothetical protein